MREPVLIIFVDTVFEADLTLINRTDADGIIWAKEVEDYQRFGVVVTDDEGYMTRIVEPSTPISKLANIGLYYYIRAVDSLAGIDHVLASEEQGRILLTDAFQWMIEHGKRILAAEVGGWYDCGAPALLETNETLLRKGAARRWTFPASPSTIRCTSRTASPSSGRDRAQRLPRARHQGARQQAAQHDRRPGRVHRRLRLDGALLGNHVVLEGYRGGGVTGRSFRVTTKG